MAIAAGNYYDNLAERLGIMFQVNHVGMSVICDRVSSLLGLLYPMLENSVIESSLNMKVQELFLWQ